MQTNDQDKDIPAPARRPHVSHKLTPEQKSEIVTDICGRISDGEYLIDIVADPELPHANTIRNWIDANSELRLAYDRALHIRGEIAAEQAVKAAFEFSPYYKDAKGCPRIDPAAVQLARLRMMALQWFSTAHLRRAAAAAEIQQKEPKFSPPPPTPEEIQERIKRVSPFLIELAKSSVQSLRESPAMEGSAPSLPGTPPEGSAPSHPGTAPEHPHT